MEDQWWCGNGSLAGSGGVAGRLGVDALLREDLRRDFDDRLFVRGLYRGRLATHGGQVRLDDEGRLHRVGGV